MHRAKDTWSQNKSTFEFEEGKLVSFGRESNFESSHRIYRDGMLKVYPLAKPKIYFALY